MERETGLEPATSSLGSWHSTAELLPHSFVFNDLRLSVSLRTLYEPYCISKLSNSLTRTRRPSTGD
jgi:hypothetical protein